MSEFQRDQPGAIHQPGIEPGANEWEPFILPLNHWCVVYSDRAESCRNRGSNTGPSDRLPTLARASEADFSLTLSQLSYFGGELAISAPMNE